MNLSKSDPTAMDRPQPRDDAGSTRIVDGIAADVATPASACKPSLVADPNVMAAKVIGREELRGFDFLDFGASMGGCIRFAKNRLGGNRGLGIDKNKAAVEKMRKHGYDCIEGDITALILPRDVVRFVTISHVLEHLPHLNAVRDAIACAARVASDFLFIQGPWFDADEYLERHGLKFYWSDWHGHPCHLTTEQLIEVLRELGLNDYVIKARVPVLDSLDPAIHPMGSARDQHDYDAGIHPRKPNVTFDIDIYREMVCYVRLQALPNWDLLLKARMGCTLLHPDSVTSISWGV